MKKNNLKTVLLLLCAAGAGFAQGIKWQETFDATTIPAGWRVIDADGSGAGLELVQQVTTPAGRAINPQTGSSFWSSDVQNASRAGVIDEWLISPRISVIYAGDSLYFWAGANDQGFDDSIRVKISTTDSRPVSFTRQLANIKVAGPAGNWTRYAFDLSDFDSSDIYFAINYYIRDGGPGGQHSDFVWIDNSGITGDAGTLNNAPSLAYLQQPVNAAVLDIEAPTIDFHWSASEDMDSEDTLHYTLSIINVFPQLHFSGITDTTFSLQWQDLLNVYGMYQWTVRVSDGTSMVAALDTFSFNLGIAPSAIDEALSSVAQDFVLQQNYPNPFNPTTFISYRLAENSSVDLSIYTMLGEKVATLVSEKQAAGDYKVQWDATGFASGVYLYRLQASDYRQIKKMVLIR